MSEAPKIEAATEAEIPASSNVTTLFPGAPRSRRVAPLTDEEILALRQMIREFAAIKGGCVLAQRALAIAPIL